VLTEWRGHCAPGKPLVFPPLGHHGNRVHEDTINAALRAALAPAKLPSTLTTYQVTRHTFGAQWAINGGSLHKLAEVLGHTSTEVTQRYAHLVPGSFTEEERALVDLDLQPAKVVPMPSRTTA
jgi:integrase